MEPTWKEETREAKDNMVDTCDLRPESLTCWGRGKHTLCTRQDQMEADIPCAPQERKMTKHGKISSHRRTEKTGTLDSGNATHKTWRAGGESCLLLLKPWKR